MKIGIVGAGAFGTALAIALGRAGREITLWARDAVQAEAMQKARENARHLPGAPLPESVAVTADFAALDDAVVLLLTVPTQKAGAVLSERAEAIGTRPVVACCKGVELTSGLGPAEMVAARAPSARPAILTGPSFADDLAAGLPTALTLACADPGEGEALQHALATPVLRLYRTTDVAGAELGGAVKNVVAIACGAAIGAGLGASARAALMTRGFAELTRYAVHAGARPETLAGLSGLGDMVLTCTSDLSRNYRYGMALGRGEGFAEDVTVEGAPTAKAVARAAREAGLAMPITAAVAALVDDEITVAGAMAALLDRPLKEE